MGIMSLMTWLKIMCKSTVEHMTGRVNIYDWTDMTKIKPLFTNLDLVNLY